MKDEEMAEEIMRQNGCRTHSGNFIQADKVCELIQKGIKYGYKAGRPQWHDLEKDPTDLPKDFHNVWCQYLDQYGEGWYDSKTGYWTLIYRDYHTHCIKAWCELPKREIE